MPPRTQQFQLLPWEGGVNTSLDQSMIPFNQLIKADDLVFGVRGSRQKRDGINFNWDNGSNVSNSIIGGIDFWFGTTSKSQLQVGVSDSKTIYQYSNGTRTGLTLNTLATTWSSAITDATFLAINNQLLIAVDGSGNVMRKWGGSGNVYDLGQLTIASATRASSGTTRTLVFASDVSSFIVPNMQIIISGSGSSSYNGTFTVSTVSTTTITFTGVGALSESTAADTGIKVILNTNPPQASILQSHLGRVWCNDKTNLDRVHYSTTSNPEEWLGLGDSGALDIGIGDGDPGGITCIFPTFKGQIFIAKRTKLYRVLNTDPENFQVELVTSGFGCVGPNAYAVVDNDDIIFVSERGVHSLEATQAYGDFSSTFVSKDIQKTFNDKWRKARLKYVKAAYVNNLNSIMFAVTDIDDSSTENKTVWLYNFDLKSWYRWPAVSCQSLFVVNDSDKRRAYLGGSTNRLAKTLNGTNYDINTSGTNTAILFAAKTGIIFMDAGPYITKAFKRFGLIYNPVGNHTITVNFKIDNFETQTLVFSASGQGSGVLGTDFTLGTSSLGSSLPTAPYSLPLDGYGRGFQVEILQSGVTEQVEIQGFYVEYELIGTQQETL